MRRGERLAFALILLGTLLPAFALQGKPSLQDAGQSLVVGNLQKAESELQSLLQESPNDYRALDLLGIVRAQQRRNLEAEELFKRVIHIQPDFASAQIHLGLLHEQMGHPDEAIADLEEGLRLDPARIDAATNLLKLCRTQAHAALTAGNPEKALSLLIKARKLAPDDPEVQFEFGMVALRMSLLPDAIDAFRKTLRLRDKDTKAIYGLGRAYLGMAKFQEAQGQFRQYVGLRPNDAAGYYALGMSCMALQQPDEARKEFEKSVALSPVQTESYFRLGLLDLDSRNFESASNNFLRVLNRDSKHAGALAGLGRVKFEQKQYPESADLLQRAVASDDSLREAHYYLGLTYARMGRKQDSDAQLEIATRLEHEETEKQRTVFRIIDVGDGTDSAQK